jgi:hypothetical protein
MPQENMTSVILSRTESFSNDKHASRETLASVTPGVHLPESPAVRMRRPDQGVPGAASAEVKLSTAFSSLS